MVFGMTVVYLFLWLMIVVVKHSSRFVVKFDYLIPDDPKPKRKAVQAPAASSASAAAVPSGGTKVKAPVPGTVLRLTASNGQQVHKGDELLVMIRSRSVRRFRHRRHPLHALSLISRKQEKEGS